MIHLVDMFFHACIITSRDVSNRWLIGSVAERFQALMSSESLAKLCGFHLVVIQRVPSFTKANIVPGCFGFVPVFLSALSLRCRRMFRVGFVVCGECNWRCGGGVARW